MGFKISWLAVQGAKSDVLDALGLRATGEMEEIFEHRFNGCVPSDGWFLVIVNEFETAAFSSDILKLLSAEQPLVRCNIHEGVMYSSAEYWEGGARRWIVSHRGDQKIFDIEADGDLPERYATVLDDLTAVQNAEGGEKADVDFIFEVPLRLAEQLCGFKHDEVMGDEPAFEVLEPVGEPADANQARRGKGFFTRLFGR